MVSTTQSQSQHADQTASTFQTPPQSSQDTEQDVVELNWVLFDKFQRSYIPTLIRIPRNLYAQISYRSLPLFAQELCKEYSVATMPDYVSFWTVGGTSFACCVASEPLQQQKEPLSIDAAGEVGWASIHDFYTNFIPISPSQQFGCKLSADTVANERIIHIVITLSNAGLAVGGSDVNGLKEFKRIFTSSCLSVARSVGRLLQDAADPRNRTFRCS